MTVGLAGSFNGLAFGPTSKFHVSAISGVDDMPELRAYDAVRTGDHGYWRGLDLLGGRQIIMTLAILGDNRDDYLALVDQAKAAFLNLVSEQALLISDSTRLIYCRPRHRTTPNDAGYRRRSGEMTVDLFATDPRVYDATQQAPTAPLPTVTTGMGFNAGFNLGFGAPATGGTVVVTNAGTAPTRPVLTILGPVTNPRVLNDTASKALKFGIVLGATDTLTIDLDAKSVLLNGTASRRSAMTSDSQWWELAPGASTLRFQGDTYDPAALLTVTFRSAWI